MEKHGIKRLFEEPETVEITPLGQVKVNREIKDRIGAISQKTKWSFSEVVEALLEEGLRVYDEQRKE
ncbi:MAG: hypothetical protein JW885_02705 [Deltaproteobacteria bacterium]|nr:hypothetical protein [Candidatus Zymogenaceae bacterium]